MMKRQRLLPALVFTVLVTSCAVKGPPISPPQISSQEIKDEETPLRPADKKPPRVKAKGGELPWREDHPALREPVSISAFNLPLGNVLQSLIEPSRLNLEIKENVDLKKTVTMKASASSLGRVLLAEIGRAHV